MTSTSTMMERKYEKAREEFVKRMMGLQHKFASWEGRFRLAKVEEKIQNNAVNGGIGIGRGTESKECNDDVDDVSANSSARESLKAREPYSTNSWREQQEEVKGTLVELRLAGLQKNDEVRAEKMKGRGRPRTGD